MDCLACTQQGHGHTHTCEGSGLAVAAAAREAGHVVDAPDVETFTVHVSAVVLGSRTDAEYVAAVLEQHCERLTQVRAYTFSTAEGTEL